MMLKLQAEEAFAAAERIAMGTGSLSEGDAREVRRRWGQALEADGRRAAAAVPATPAQLRSVGIGVRRVLRGRVTP